MTPFIEGAGVLRHARFPRQLRHQVIGNIVANLPQNGEFCGGWKFCVIHPLPCGKFSWNFQPLFIIPKGWQ